MSRLPPVEKLPLAVRKDVRDEWENKKGELEQSISNVLGVPWTLDINPNQIYAYATDDYAKRATGSMLAGYINGAESQLRSFVDKYEDDGKQELNTICSAHVITMDLDVNKKVSYCGCEVSPSGQLVILFAQGYLGTNIDYALSTDNLTQALNQAPAPPSLSMSFLARASIRTHYDAEIAETQAKIKSQLQRDVVLDAGFEAVFAKMKASGISDDDRWQENLGGFVRAYFDAFSNWLQREKVGDDELLREGVNEAVESGKVAFRVVDEGKMEETYNEAVIQDGVLYLQTVPQYFGTNIGYIADKLMDKL
ncbi:Uncharacterized protein TPAR_02755 [Tolypocladium paradoxum]|uniref:Uncharacterized protein n=1 Tax=Tolypocladium paradoxum TaxID=94208 RepID=A0A2S4L3M6_9HYPO|nr:Uncharacterized protein TPAR_02755 [Tolypocladium paradoxum]